jgi:hypothetical protein
MTDAVGRLDEIDRHECRADVVGTFSAARMVDDHLDLFRRMTDPAAPLEPAEAGRAA